MENLTSYLLGISEFLICIEFSILLKVLNLIQFFQLVEMIFIEFVKSFVEFELIEFLTMDNSKLIRMNNQKLQLSR